MVDFYSGLIGGMAGTIVGHPMDTIKYCLLVYVQGRLQTQGVGGRAMNYANPYHCFVDICKTEGVRALYKGLMPPLMSTGLLNAIVFGVYGQAMSRLQPNGGRPTPSSIVLSSTVASVAQIPIASVTELVKLRLQTQGIKQIYSTASSKGPFQITWLIYQREGVKGLFKGMGTSGIRDTIGFISYFMTYELLCQIFAGNTMMNELSSVHLMVSGGIAGMVTWASCYPLDVVKSRIQTDRLGTEAEYQGMVDCFRKSYSSDGWRVFYRGLGVTLLRAFPVNAVTFYVITCILRICKKGNREHSVL